MSPKRRARPCRVLCVCHFCGLGPGPQNSLQLQRKTGNVVFRKLHAVYPVLGEQILVYYIPRSRNTFALSLALLKCTCANVCSFCTCTRLLRDFEVYTVCSILSLGKHSRNKDSLSEPPYFSSSYVSELKTTHVEHRQRPCRMCRHSSTIYPSILFRGMRKVKSPWAYAGRAEKAHAVRRHTQWAYAV